MSSPEADLVGARAASTSDLGIIADLRSLAQAEVKDERGGRWLLSHDLPKVLSSDPLNQALIDDRQRLVAGLIDGVVVGHGLAHLSSASDAELCIVIELYVHPKARGIGVGAAMLAELRQWAREKSCAAIESQVLPGNRAAKNFFERVGMVTRKMRVSVDLD